MGKVQLQYDIVGGLYVCGCIGLDCFINCICNLMLYGIVYSLCGQFFEGQQEVQELNMEFLFGYDQDLMDNILISVFVGGNQQCNFFEFLGGFGNNFNILFFYVIGNL